MSKTVTVNGGGIFLPLLAILFIGMKLTGYVSWPWLWVLAPVWGPLALIVALLVVMALVYLIVKALK